MLLDLSKLLVPHGLLPLGLLAIDLLLLLLHLILFCDAIFGILVALHWGISKCLLLLGCLETCLLDLRLGVGIPYLKHLQIAIDASEFLSGSLEHLFDLSTVVLEFLEILSLQALNMEDMATCENLQLL